MSGSILTNNMSLSALATLRALDSQMQDSQNKVSTGLRIGQASDNIAYWGLSNNMRNDASVLNTVKDSLHLGQSKVNQSNVANKAITEQIKSLKSNMAEIISSEDNPSRVKTITAAIKSELEQIKNAISNAAIDGENMLANNGKAGTDEKTTINNVASTIHHPGDTFDFVSSFRRSGDTVITDSIKINQEDVQLAGLNTKDGSIDFTKGKLKDLFDEKNIAFITAPAAKGDSETVDKKVVDAFNEIVLKAADSVANVDTILGTAKTQIDGQVEFVTNLVNNLNTSVGALVDADLDAESARYSALKIQQKLATQALSLANQSAQHILELYRG